MADETLVLIRFDETITDGTAGYADETGNLGELRPPAGVLNDGLVSGYCGRAAALSPDSPTGFVAQDVVSGSTLAQRDATVQMIISVDVDGQMAVSDTGTIIAHGKGTGAAEYVSLGVQIRVLDQASRRCELRWFWQTAAGVDKIQVGGHFTAAEVGTFTLLTATRRWVSSTEVVLCYYLGPVLIAEIASVDGDIGGGTTGTTSVGMRFRAGVWNDHAGARLDELRVTNYAMCAEEIEATWNRIAIYQPEGYRQIVAALPPGWPFTLDPSSKNQQHMRLAGNALGFADAQAEHLRANLMPDRAFGSVLAQWERIVGESPRATDTIQARRARVLAHLSAVDGCSPAGVTTALAELCACGSEQLEILAFDATMREDFAGGVIEAERWRADPIANWDITGGAARVQGAIAADVRWDGSAYRNARTLLTSAEKPVGMIAFGKITLTALPDGGEAGILLYNWARGDAFWLGVRRVGAVYSVGHQRFEAWAPIEAWTVDAVSANTPHWLMLDQSTDVSFLGAGRAKWTLSWSTTSGTAGFASSALLEWINDPAWVGPYLRATALLPTAADVRFDDLAIRERRGVRPDRLYIYRDPALPGAPDLAAADRVLKRLRQAHTYAAVIDDYSVIADDAGSTADAGPLGGL